MKLSELRPCDNCGGKIAPSFYVLRQSLAFFSPNALRDTMGLAQFFGGSAQAMAIAEVMSPSSDVVKVAGDEDESLMTETFLCMNCYVRPVCIAQLAEQRTAAEKAVPQGAEQ